MLDAWTGAGSFMGNEVPVSLANLVERVIAESGLEQMYKAGKTDTDVERLENLAELVSSAREFEEMYDPANDPAMEFVPGPVAPDPGAPSATMPPLLAMLRAYLERITLVADADTIDPSQGAVTLMTLHAAKGLEFRAVAMIGLEEGTLPHSRSDQSDEQLEEERRLCFVGITRAMERLMITAAKYRTIRGVSERTIPSRFLGELPAEHVSVSDQSDSFAAGYDFDGDGSPSTLLDRPSSFARGQGAQSSQQGSWLRVGAVVRHPQFGVGTVKSVTRGSDARAKIAFQGVGEKTLVLEYARLQRA
jgi:DNA helicase-2/ATP-dependent DNA helicase PcrA